MERVFDKCPIYWINLDSSVDRKISMEIQLKNLNHTRIPAINGLDAINFTVMYKVINPNPTHSIPLIAATCSHLKAIKTAYDNKLPYVIILEDKCHFDHIQNYPSTIQDIISSVTTIDPLWNIVQLSSIPLYDNFDDFTNNGFHVRKRRNGLYGLNYLINLNGMEQILKLVETDGEYSYNLSNVTQDSSPEKIILDRSNSYIVNLPMLYVFANKSTFPFYKINGSQKEKIICRRLQLEAMAKINGFYEKNDPKLPSET